MARRPPAAPRSARDERASSEARIKIERAEHAWRRRVDDEGGAFHLPLLAPAVAMIVPPLFDRLARLG